jgi:hypothetical protein
MAAIGARGGRASVRKRLGVNGDDALRETARRRLLEAISGDDARLALQASRAVFSYGSSPPPTDAPEPTPEPPTIAGVRVTGISDVVLIANELGVDIGQNELRLEVERLRLENERLRSQLAG